MQDIKGSKLVGISQSQGDKLKNQQNNQKNGGFNLNIDIIFRVLRILESQNRF